MKKAIPALLCLLCALAAGTAAFFGCTGGGDNPGGATENPGGSTETPDDGDDTPDEPAPPTYTEVLTDGSASFSPDNAKTVIKNARYPYNEGWTDEHTYIFTIETGWSNTDTAIRENAVELSSSDQNIIPNDALSYDTVTNMDLVGSRGDNHIQQIEIMLDTSKVSKGSAYVTMGFASSNNSLHKFELCAELTVVEQGEYEVETMSETLEIDVRRSDASDCTDFSIMFWDEDYIEGAYVNGEACEYSFEINLKAEDGIVSVTFDYIVGHRYSITLTSGAEYDVYSALELSNTVSGGNGYYIEGDDPSAYLVYEDPGETVEIEAGDWFYPDKH